MGGGTGTGAATTGGRTGSGGTASTGGTSSQGGRSGTGGRPGSGGSSGSGGDGGAGGTSNQDGGAGGSSGRPDGGTDTSGRADGGSEVGSDAGLDDYRPCPASGNPCKILPLGDSITWGVGDEGNAGYRGPLFALSVSAQQKITFSGSLSNGPSTIAGQPFPQKNEGHSGWNISTVNQYSDGHAGIATVIPSPAFDNASGGVPNIILLHIGTNDTGSSTGAEMASRLDALIDKITTAAPDALLVVAKIIPLSWATTAINDYNKAIPGIVTKHASAGKHVEIVDMNTGFTSSTMMSSDNIHPNSAGYKFMSDRWYSVIGPLLPE